MKKCKMPLYKFLLAFGLYSIFLVSCDVAEQDKLVPKENLDITVFENHSVLFDFASKVKSQDAIVVSIASQPSRGALSSEDFGLFKYAPNSSFTSGQDAFDVSIRNAKTGVVQSKKMTLRMAGQNDCAGIAVDDLVNNVTTSPVQIDVLSNDILINSCGGNYQISLYKPQVKYPPYDGTAEVINNKFIYTPSSNFKGEDKFFYQLDYIDQAGNKAMTTFGRVAVTNLPPCSFSVQDDSYRFDLSSIGSVVYLPVFDNDVICKSFNSSSNDIDGFGNRVERVADADGNLTQIAYYLNETGSNSNRVLYTMCSDGKCYNGNVNIEFVGQASCLVRALGESYSVVGSTQQEFIYQILQNDNLCNETIADIKLVRRELNYPSGIQTFSEVQQYINSRIFLQNNELHYKPDALSQKIRATEEVEYEIKTASGKYTRATVRIQVK
jgi:hypothetical protein